MSRAIAAVVGASCLLLVGVSRLEGEQAGERIETPLARLEIGAKRIGWDGIELGMSLVQVERRAGQSLALSPSGRAGCRAATLAFDHRSLQLTIDLDGAKPGAKVTRLLVHFEGHQIAASRAELVADLHRLAPGAVYQPPADDPEMQEADDPRPTFVMPGAAGSAVRLMPRFGVLLAARGCLD